MGQGRASDLGADGEEVANVATMTGSESATTARTRSATTTAPTTVLAPLPDAVARSTGTTASMQVPAEVASLLPANATILAAQQPHLQDDAGAEWAVLYRLPGPGGAKVPYPPPST